MVHVSVVIITKNESETIASCVKACKLISDDIIVVDNGSGDSTPLIAMQAGCKVFNEHWDGYGANKNKGIRQAKYDWILSIDADEIPDMELIRSLHETELNDPLTVYDIKFISYYCNKPVRFGSWGRDHHIRLFNRKLVKWNEPLVHESLVLPASSRVKTLNGHIHHYSVKDIMEGYSKTLFYARLSAEKYFAAGRKATFTKLHIAPVFHFVKNYIVFLGLLDGRKGFEIANMISRHTRLKYRILRKMSTKEHIKVPYSESSLVVEQI